jgi:hypothetical protein
MQSYEILATLAPMKALGIVCLGAMMATVAAARADDLSAGGLRPPPAVQSDPFVPPSGTQADLDRADREDSGRGLSFLWLNGEIGLSHLGLETFSANDLVDAEVVQTKSSGLLYGAGAGVRLLFLTLGGRFRLGDFEDWQLWTLNAEVGVRVPLGPIEPYFLASGGYASLGSFGGANVGPNLRGAGVEVSGYNVRGGGGIDVYLGNVVSVGGSITGDLLFLSRTRVDPSKLGDPATPDSSLSAQIYAKDGSSVGGSATFTAVLGLHF